MADTDIRAIVERYVAAGWAVIPIAPGKKRPTENDWQKKAAKKQYGPDSFGPSDNIGVALGEASDWRADVDLDHALAVEAAKYLLPDTGLIHGRAGKPSSHWWYRSEGLSFYFKYKDPTDKEGLVELRAMPSHQTVIPPGVHASGDDISWEREGDPLEIDDPAILKKAVANVAIAALLAKHWPTEQGARHELALTCAGFFAKVMDDDADTAYRILETAFRIARDDDWKDRARAARETIKKAQGDGDKRITGVPRFIKEFPNGRKIADAVLEWLGKKSDDAPVGRIEELNERYFKVPYGNDVVVAEPRGNVDGTIRLWPAENFDKLFWHEKVTVGKAAIGMGKYWREHEGSARRDRLVFAPPGSRLLPLGAADYNGWRGFTVEPAEGDWSKNKAHVRDVICAGDEQLFEWTLDWMADLFQQPGRRAMTSLVLLGGQGTGKGHFLDKMLGECLDRQHYAHVIDRKAIFGDFNDVLSGKVLVFLDEASWGGDKRDAGIIKGLVTERTIGINRKFLPRVEEDSMMHLAIASNEEWPVGLDRDDRRFAVYQVDERHRNSQAYFEPLLAELENGGRAAMLHELLARRIRNNLRQPPRTDARTRLKKRSLDADTAWWLDKLEEGVVLRGHNGWQTEIVKDDLYDDYVERMRNVGAARKKAPSELSTHLRRMVPTIGERRSRPDMKRKWLLPTLPECREHFEAALRETWAWPGDPGSHVKTEGDAEL